MEDNNSDEGSIFDIDVTDDHLLQLIKKPFEESEAYWETEVGLKRVREENMNLWTPNHYKNKEVYDFQEESLYQDNRIFVSVETTISILNSRIPAADVMPAQDTVVSEQAAKSLSKSLYAHADKYMVLDAFRISTRNLLLKRIGYLKLRWDPSIGKTGDIVTEAIPPEDIIVDKDTRLGDIPRFIAQKIKNKTLEELIAMFPDSEQKIYEMGGVQRRNGKGDLVAQKSQLSRKKNILEVWFVHQKDGQYQSSVAWVDENFQHVFDKQKNPNWNYEEEEGFMGNFLDRPIPPFIPLNYLNDGTSYVDLTSMVEQAAPLQKILNRRGFQIMENADQAGGGLVFNTTMIEKKDIIKLVGAPDERIGVKGSVRDAITRVAPPPLPSYVLEDKYDARKEIDTIFATHSVTRGEESGNRTLGQDQLQRDQNYTRMDDISRAIERSATLYYRYLVQMMKVYFTEEHYYKTTGEDGQFDYHVMRSDLIEDGIDIRVEASSMQPINKERQMSAVQDLVQVGLIDPLSVYEVVSGGSLPNPRKMLERFLLYKTDPIAFMGKVKEDEFSRDAFMDIQVLNRGAAPKLRDEYKPEYLQFMNNYMLTGDFEKQPDMVKRLYMEYLQVVMMQVQKQTMAAMTQMPTEEEVAASNQKAVAQAQLEQQAGGVSPEAAQGVQGQADQLADKADQKTQQFEQKAQQAEQAAQKPIM